MPACLRAGRSSRSCQIPIPLNFFDAHAEQKWRRSSSPFSERTFETGYARQRMGQFGPCWKKRCLIRSRRAAYQMFDGTVSVDQVRAACKMSPNAVVALTPTRCVAMGLMEANEQKKRVRLFDLNDFRADG